MASPAPARPPGPRKAILDLAPLELDCMNTLWPLGEATVRQIQQQLLPSRPRAYTTILTIMDRLARKGVVLRRKHGRAYLYRPNLTAEQARAHAVEQVVEGFFEGSVEALATHVAGRDASARRAPRAYPLVPLVPEQAGDESAEPLKSSSVVRLDESLL